jgi:hypothetical protein
VLRKIGYSTPSINYSEIDKAGRSWSDYRADLLNLTLRVITLFAPPAEMDVRAYLAGTAGGTVILLVMSLAR